MSGGDLVPIKHSKSLIWNPGVAVLFSHNATGRSPGVKSNTKFIFLLNPQTTHSCLALCATEKAASPVQASTRSSVFHPFMFQSLSPLARPLHPFFVPPSLGPSLELTQSGPRPWTGAKAVLRSTRLSDIVLQFRSVPYSPPRSALVAKKETQSSGSWPRPTSQPVTFDPLNPGGAGHPEPSQNAPRWGAGVATAAPLHPGSGV